MGAGHSHGEHGHSHVGVDSNIVKNKEATRVLMISLVAMLITAIFQAIIVALSGSVALLADTIHNFGDALTSIPLWIAFVLSRRLPTKRFTYGLNRSEDLAGLLIIIIIAISAVVAGYESIQRLFNGSSLTNLWAVAIASIVGFLGNELVAIYRIRMGKRMGSAALVADGHHARVDGITSLAVLIGVIGTWLGFSIIDPIVGLGITITIIFIVKDSVKTIFSRLLDGMEPKTIDLITASVEDVKGVIGVTEVKARWFGHEITADISIAVESDLSITEGHHIAKKVIDRLQHDVEHLGAVHVHIDPEEEPGAGFHSHGHASTYPFEWAGIYELSIGDYEYILDAGPDPAMLISFLPLSASTQEVFEVAKLDAIRVFKGTAQPLASGGILQPSYDQTQLLLDGDATFVVRITKPGSYALFTEHHPDEFAAVLRHNGSSISVTLEEAFPSAHGHSHG
ncbi:cation diffusion facilitator family transporter [Paenibacillus alginolyticus]|uniref:Cation diffusion facilitator family transporter n=1 Tax=Paenibacillus alginolyticus TaxID=59839 RepID=A0ABT4GBB1_9BACL|nr:cation diffusion facilitator family transporter [Paenibacillus alginolyticus]MCY9693414.1 cation diffusion facilitator family transporter [Paenibacillus alginolyticus]MEC0144674.1 cation diffusion facilitator family transporter [Paenibacillus alginolyticus]